VSVCAQLEQSAAEQVELNSQLCGCGWIDHAGNLMSGKDIPWICPEVLDAE